MKHISLILFIFMVLLIAGCKNEKDGKKEKINIKTTENVETIFAVNTIRSIKGEINDYISLNGDIKSKNQVDVYPDNMGKLVNIYIKVGQYVEKGQIIADVDPSKPGMDYAISTIKAPISGTIMDAPLQVGSTVSQQISVAKIGNLNSLEIASYISEKYISKMKIGLPVIVTIEAFPETVFKGYLSFISPIVDPQTRMLEIKILLNERDARIKSGMFTKLKIITEQKANIVKIPVDCIVARYGENFVFLVKSTIPKIITGTSLKKHLENGISKEDFDFFKTKYKEDATTDKIALAEQKKNAKKNNKKKTELDLIIDTVNETSIYKLDNSLTNDELKKLSSIINFMGFFYVEKRQISSGIQIDNKIEITSGLLPDEEIVMRGQTLLENNSKIKVIDRIEPLSKTDIVK